MNNGTKTEKFERCVICGALTDISVDTPIDLRRFYVEGCGQVCVKCHQKLQRMAKKENALATVQLLHTVAQKEE
ncbi:MAG: hypothetical protein IJN17_04355 [Clostridia bacterium]|nr:hypothetical protein [Clostridia bacterium]